MRLNSNWAGKVDFFAVFFTIYIKSVDANLVVTGFKRVALG